MITPPHVREVLFDDEVPMYDPDVIEWFGVKDGDWEEWRNIRPLGLYGPIGLRNCDARIPRKSQCNMTTSPRVDPEKSTFKYFFEEEDKELG